VPKAIGVSLSRKKRGERLRRQIALLAFAFLLVGLAAAVYAIPQGATVSVGKPQTKNFSSPGNVTAAGGNITEVNVTVESQTRAWQGFWGDVNGSLVLQDAAAFNFYTWTLFTVTGEVYASRDNAVQFTNIAPNNNCSTDNTLTGFNFADSANNTFINNSNVQIQVGFVTINATTSCAVYTYVNSSPQTSFFQTIQLTSLANFVNDSNVSNMTGGNNTIFATNIENQTLSGYNTDPHGYQLLVPVDRTAGLNTYFFYAELS
jgi:hypothetical protein